MKKIKNPNRESLFSFMVHLGPMNTRSLWRGNYFALVIINLNTNYGAKSDVRLLPV